MIDSHVLEKTISLVNRNFHMHAPQTLHKGHTVLLMHSQANRARRRLQYLPQPLPLPQGHSGTAP